MKSFLGISQFHNHIPNTWPCIKKGIWKNGVKCGLCHFSRSVVGSFMQSIVLKRSQLPSAVVCQAGLKAFFEFTSASLSKWVKLQSLSYEYQFSFMLKLITTTKISCLDSRWKREREELENGHSLPSPVFDPWASLDLKERLGYRHFACRRSRHKSTRY